MKVLYVEDDWVYRKLLSGALESVGFEVVVAINGIDALGILENDQGIEIIISDMDMPKMDGSDFCKEAKKIFPNIPFIGYSGNEDAGEEFMKAGANDFYLKKGSSNELIKKIQRLTS